MLAPPLDVPMLLAKFIASEIEATTKAYGDRMTAAEALQKELWRQRRALIAFITDRELAPPPPAAAGPDQPDLL